MSACISFFPVGNGDMTLMKMESGRKVLIDLNIRVAADDPDDATPDVASMLRERLERDTQGRLFVDTLLVSHPDQDHCSGLKKHFHLGPPWKWSAEDDKIFVRELWSSPIVFRRASKNHVLCADAKAFNTEARRRVQRYRDSSGNVGNGDRILILGEDEDGKTDDLAAILVRVNETFSVISGEDDSSVTARLLGPLAKSDDEDEEETLSKNRSSTILSFSLAGDHVPDSCRFLTGGDAEVAIWERLWQLHSSEWLSYDILQTPHHCSWHSLSHDSWSEMGEDAQVSQDARNALSQARGGAVIVVSSNAIKDDESDPPCIRAKREYVAIADDVTGIFKCVGEHPPESSPDVMEFEIGKYGLRLRTVLLKAPAVLTSGAVGRQPLAHG